MRSCVTLRVERTTKILFSTFRPNSCNFHAFLLKVSFNSNEYSPEFHYFQFQNFPKKLVHYRSHRSPHYSFDKCVTTGQHGFSIFDFYTQLRVKQQSALKLTLRNITKINVTLKPPCFHLHSKHMILELISIYQEVRIKCLVLPSMQKRTHVVYARLSRLNIRVNLEFSKRKTKLKSPRSKWGNSQAFVIDSNVQKISSDHRHEWPCYIAKYALKK